MLNLHPQVSISPTLGAVSLVNMNIMAIIFLDFLMLDQIFLSPQVTPSPIISNKHGIYELPHELPNNVRLRILEY